MYSVLSILLERQRTRGRLNGLGRASEIDSESVNQVSGAN